MALLDASSTGGPRLLGMPMKQVSLITLTFQNCALILIMHYSRIMPLDGDHRYFPSTAIFLDEIMKLAISMTFAIYDASNTLAPQAPVTALFEHIFSSVFSGDGWKLAVPATLYTLQNTLQYVALSNLDAVHFQILYQLKILTTAFFMVVMLGRSLSARRWLSLVLLTVGVSIVCLPSGSKRLPFAVHDTSARFFPRSMHELGQLANGAADAAMDMTRRAVDEVAGGLAKRSASYQGIQEDEDNRPVMNYSLGVSAVVAASVLSGLTGVYFEKILKNSSTPVSVWTRNMQMAFYSLFPSLFFGVILKDGGEIAKHGFFDGYNGVVWTLVVLQAVGGLLSSLCINYADNIAKNFATSISIVIGFLISVWFFNFQASFPLVLGASIVLFATYLYSGPDRKRGRPPPISIVGYEKTTIDQTPRAVNSAGARLMASSASLEPPDLMRTGLSTSRPASPFLHNNRVPSARGRSRED
ncbi:hypothetical protein P8C59_009037 [Phyllachora maydis]|uniref:UDP-galactose transporter n=1 Tax=Phyllachora maydis TaxID=1825666 RepID=A0AAD9MHS7_9PEZI|nr:hypothetical protein P8C59_009037 [Phyllachora maydis]